MVGGSYGGQVQFAAAGIDKRIDTIVPLITWNDLSYSLSRTTPPRSAPPSTASARARRASPSRSGRSASSGSASSTARRTLPTDPARVLGCPNFATFVCPTLLYAATNGTVTAYETAKLRHASVTNYMRKIRIPTLIVQGQNDTLFNLNEGVANYRALKAQGTPVKMIWMNGGHSGPAAPGELETGSPDPATQYVTGRIADWLDHYLKGTSADTGPEFSYFRDWVSYSGIATPAYADSPTYPVGTPDPVLPVEADWSPASRRSPPARKTFVTPPGGLPSSFDELDAVGALADPADPAPGDGPPRHVRLRTPRRRTAPTSTSSALPG